MATKKRRNQPKTEFRKGPKLTHKNFKNVPVHKVPDGKPLQRAFDCGHGWYEYELVGSRTPEEGKLENFRVMLVDGVSQRELLILDDYGDEIILDDYMRRRLFTSKYGDDTIGIFLDTGEIVRVAFILETHEGLGSWYSVVFYSFDFPIFVPKKWLTEENLRELSSAKRPFMHTFNAAQLVQFMHREASYEDLNANRVISLDFGKTHVEIWSQEGRCCFREVTSWEDVPEPKQPSRRPFRLTD